jgi:hypothetical protein
MNVTSLELGLTDWSCKMAMVDSGTIRRDDLLQQNIDVPLV